MRHADRDNLKPFIPPPGLLIIDGMGAGGDAAKCENAEPVGDRATLERAKVRRTGGPEDQLGFHKGDTVNDHRAADDGRSAKVQSSDSAVARHDRPADDPQTAPLVGPHDIR